jgi:enamine deaminase RidA (YjgF/YER057c/UK114 family)
MAASAGVSFAGTLSPGIGAGSVATLRRWEFLCWMNFMRSLSFCPNIAPDTRAVRRADVATKRRGGEASVRFGRNMADRALMLGLHPRLPRKQVRPRRGCQSSAVASCYIARQRRAATRARQFVYNGPSLHFAGKESTMTLQRYHVGKRLADMVVHGGTIYLAGQVADDLSADVTTQTRQVLANIDQLLGEVGSDKTKILSVTIYLPDMNDFGAMNAVWEAWVPAGQTPARATVQARLAASGYKIEIQVIAAT